MEPLELEDGQDYPESSLLGSRHSDTMRRPLRRRRFGNCTRVIVFFAIAFGVVILPLGMLRTMEGIENAQGGLMTSSDGQTHKEVTSSVIVSAVAEVTPALSSITAPAVTSSVSSVTSSAPSSSPQSARPNLPERELTKYVDPLIGTEGYGHGSPYFDSFNCSIRRSNYPFRYGETCSRQ